MRRKTTELNLSSSYNQDYQVCYKDYLADKIILSYNLQDVDYRSDEESAEEVLQGHIRPSGRVSLNNAVMHC